MFRFVIVGSGNISQTFLKVILNLEGVEVIGLVSRSGSRPDFAPSHIEVATSLKQIQGDFEGVILATPNGLHHEGAVQAAALGKHVLTEKPLDITVPHMNQMIKACQDANVKLGVAYQHRMNLDNQIFKSLLDSGELGRIYSADFEVRCYRDQAYFDSGAWRGGWEIDGGGPFMQQASHQLDLYIWFFGMPETVHAFTETYVHPIEVEDHGAALFRYANGMIGTFITSTIASPGFDPELTILAEKGTVIMKNDRITGWHIPGLKNPSQNDGKEIHSGAAGAGVSDTRGHEVIVQDFVDAVQKDRDPAITGESARLATELALKIYGKL